MAFNRRMNHENICDKCKKRIKDFSFKCHRCTGQYCDKHRLPEDHNCPGLAEYKKHTQEKWEKTIKASFTNKNKDESRINPISYHPNKEEPREQDRPHKSDFFNNTFSKIKSWLSRREYNSYENKRFNYLLKILVVLIVSIIAFVIFYSNIIRLNEINLWIIKIGGVLLLISLFFIIKYGYKSIKEILNWIKRQRNWFKYLLLVILLILLWQAYAHRTTILNPAFNIYNKTNFSLFMPISLGNFSFSSDSNPSSSASSDNSWISKIGSQLVGPNIDDTWVHNFMLIVNNERVAKGLSTMQESTQLDSIATSRFNKMMEQPFISHYGADAYNIGEVIFYPKGSTDQEYIDDIKSTAPLHWDLLMDSSFSNYGYHVEEGPTIMIIGSCSTTEIPGPNIDVKQFFEQQGCSTEEQNSIWLVIDMS